MIHGYINTTEKCSMAVQKNLIHQYTAIKFPGIVPTLHVDRKVSPAAYLFCERPAGMELHLALKPGDHVIFPELARAFWSAPDFVRCVTSWRDVGVSVHVVDMLLDASTNIGKLLLRQLVQLLALNPRHRAVMMSRRHQTRRASGLAGQGHTPWGKKRLGKGATARIVPDEKALALGRLIVHLRDMKRMAWIAIGQECVIGKERVQQIYNAMHKIMAEEVADDQ